MITQERLKELINYSPDEGKFIWKVQRGRCRKGSNAGTVDARGLVLIAIDRVQYMAHRLATLYMKGEMQDCGHIDGDSTNNRWNNLSLNAQCGTFEDVDLSKKYAEMTQCPFISKSFNQWGHPYFLVELPINGFVEVKRFSYSVSGYNASLSYCQDRELHHLDKIITRYPDRIPQ